MVRCSSPPFSTVFRIWLFWRRLTLLSLQGTVFGTPPPPPPSRTRIIITRPTSFIVGIFATSLSHANYRTSLRAENDNEDQGFTRVRPAEPRGMRRTGASDALACICSVPQRAKGIKRTERRAISHEVYLSRGAASEDQQARCARCGAVRRIRAPDVR